MIGFLGRDWGNRQVVVIELTLHDTSSFSYSASRHYSWGFGAGEEDVLRAVAIVKAIELLCTV